MHLCGGEGLLTGTVSTGNQGRGEEKGNMPESPQGPGGEHVVRASHPSSVHMGYVTMGFTYPLSGLQFHPGLERGLSSSHLQIQPPG